MAGRMSVSVKSDIADALEHFETLSAALKRNAIAAALNRVADMARTAASREIREVYRIKARDVSSAIKVYRASGRSTSLEARVVAKGRHSLPLVDFAARQTKKGVTVSIKKRGGRKLFPGAFIATMKSGHTGVFTRGNKGRLPIKERFTIGVPYQFAARQTISAMFRIVKEKFPERLRHELEQAVARRNARGFGS